MSSRLNGTLVKYWSNFCCSGFCQVKEFTYISVAKIEKEIHQNLPLYRKVCYIMGG